MKDAHKLPQSVLSQANPPAEPVAMPGDMLQIIISSRNPEAVKPYNKSSYLSDLGSSTTSGSSENSLEYYLVDGSGNIEFPVIGSINILRNLFSQNCKVIVLQQFVDITTLSQSSHRKACRRGSIPQLPSNNAWRSRQPWNYHRTQRTSQHS